LRSNDQILNAGTDFRK